MMKNTKKRATTVLVGLGLVASLLTMNLSFAQSTCSEKPTRGVTTSSQTN